MNAKFIGQKKNRLDNSTTSESQPMKVKLFKILIPLLYFSSLIYSFYIGRYETIYGAGASTVLLFQIIGLIVFIIHLIIRKFKFIASLQFAAILVTALQFLMIIQHEINSYKPTITIQIPETYEGCIYLFTTTQDRQDIEVNHDGIGYIGNTGKVKWRIKRGKVNITEAFGTSQANDILLYNDLKTRMTAYNVMCIDINDSNIYAPPLNYSVIPCMSDSEFLFWVEEGLVQEDSLRKRVWNGSGDGEDWKLDVDKSRL